MEESTWLHFVCCGGGITILGVAAGSACGEGGREQRGAGSLCSVTRWWLCPGHGVAAALTRVKGGGDGSRDGGHPPAAAGPGCRDLAEREGVGFHG